MQKEHRIFFPTNLKNTSSKYDGGARSLPPGAGRDHTPALVGDRETWNIISQVSFHSDFFAGVALQTPLARGWGGTNCVEIKDAFFTV